jgi:hypothetical protein
MVSRVEKDEAVPRSLIISGMLSGELIEFGAGGFEPHELKASGCANETWCVPMGLVWWVVEEAQAAGTSPLSQAYLRIVWQPINAPTAQSPATATKMARAQAQLAWLFGVGKKFLLSHDPVS